MKKLYVKKMVQLQMLLQEIGNDESGMGMVEIALIIIVIITLGLTFKTRIVGLLDEIFDTFNYSGLSA